MTNNSWRIPLRLGSMVTHFQLPPYEYHWATRQARDIAITANSLGTWFFSKEYLCGQCETSFRNYLIQNRGERGSWLSWRPCIQYCMSPNAGKGVAGSQPMSTAVHIELKKALWRSNSIFHVWWQARNWLSQDRTPIGQCSQSPNYSIILDYFLGDQVEGNYDSCCSMFKL